MKLKGINFFEANADKIVLGVTGLTFLGVIAMQFLVGNYVKVGSDDKLTAGNAFRPVEEEANKLAAKLKSENPKLPEAPAFTLTEKLQDLAGKPLGDDGVRVALGVPPMIQMAPRDATIAAATYELPKVPAPGPAVAAPYAATVSPIEVVAHPELAAILPKEQPFDKMIVSIESTFDGAALRDALQADPDGEGPREALPLAWWRDPADQGDDLVTIVGIEAERELIRNPDGTTPSSPEVTMVQAAPARPDGLKTWQQGVRSLGDVPPTILTLRSEMDQILRPSFYQTIAGPAWTSPAEFVAQGDQNEKTRLVKRQRDRLTKLDQDISRVQDLISKAPDPGARRTEAPTPPRGGEGGGGRGGRGGAAGPSGPAPSSPKSEPKGDRRVLEARLKTLQTQRENLVKDLTKLGEHVDGAVPGAEISLAQGPQPGLLEGGEQKFWVHDVNAEPGAVYRYHVRVVVNNPLFGRNLQDSQKQMADGSLIRSEWSEWTAPVQVDQPRVMFVSSASEAGQLEPRPHASVELYQFYYGYYRQALAGLDPGEPAIGKATLPELKLADMTKLAAMYKSGDPALGVVPEQAAPPPPGPIGRRGAVGEGGPGRGRPGGGSYEGAGGNVPPQTPATPEGPKFPAWMDIEAPKSLALGGDMVFLDAGVVPLSPGDQPGSTQGIEALFRNPNGLLIVRRPDKESQEPYLARVRSSATAGRTQGVEIKPLEVPKQAPVRDERRRPTPGSGGGGGGGGGGG